MGRVWIFSVTTQLHLELVNSGNTPECKEVIMIQCFDKVMVTRVEVLENKKTCGNEE